MSTDPIRIANCSGFFGDRPSGALEMVEGGPIDVLTGDWLAELTMLILSRIRTRRPGAGYAGTFVKQMEQVMGTCLDKGIKVVSNAGGLDPDGCAEAVAQVAQKLGLSPTIAYVNGDDLMPRVGELLASGALTAFDDGNIGGPLGEGDNFVTANAYLGCWGIVDALSRGADIVITGRVTDAAVVCGPAAWHHGWQRDDFDQLAGAVAAGHVIECSAQATGGNYSFFHEIPGLDGVDDVRGEAVFRLGFPWADIAADGSSIIGKHDNTGGAVSVGTVTSQLLYEIGGPAYLGPDVTARFDSISLERVARDRVQMSGVRGEEPPATLKVAMNQMGGFRNSFSVAITGMDIEAKAAFAKRAFWEACPFAPEDYEHVDDRLIRTEHVDPASQEAATAVWRVTVKDADERKVGRAFSNAMTQTALASIPGMYGLSGSPSAGQPYGVYRPATINAELVPNYVHVLPTNAAKAASTHQVSSVVPAAHGANISHTFVDQHVSAPDGPTQLVPIGRVVGTRSGDKGGNANLGVFARNDQGWAWLDTTLTVERLQELLPETAGLAVDRFRFPNLFALNFVIHGLLQEGVASSTRQDAQAKALGEWLRARQIDIPLSVIEAQVPRW